MKLFTKILLATCLFASALGTAAMAQSVANTDSMETITRNLSGFTSIKIGGPFDVHLVQGPVESVKYVAGADIKNRITCKVTGSVLKIHNTHDNWGTSNKSWYGEKSVWHNHKKIQVYITAKDVSRIVVSGSGDVVFDDGVKAARLRLRVRGSGEIMGKVDVNKLDSRLSGSGHIKLSGNAVASSVRVVGSGHFEAGNLVTTQSAAHVSGSGHALVNANEKVNAVVRGSGEVSYTGQPKSVSKSTSGSGEVNSRTP